MSIDGASRSRDLGVGMEVRVWSERIRARKGRGEDGSEGEEWVGGVPAIVRDSSAGGASGGRDGKGDDHWVGGLNGLLKFNYPFGEES